MMSVTVEQAVVESVTARTRARIAAGSSRDRDGDGLVASDP